MNGQVTIKSKALGGCKRKGQAGPPLGIIEQLNHPKQLKELIEYSEYSAPQQYDALNVSSAHKTIDPAIKRVFIWSVLI